MSAPTKLWAVATGEYSDYRVMGLFATEDLAKAFREREDRVDSGLYVTPFIQEFWLHDELPAPYASYSAIWYRGEDRKPFETHEREGGGFPPIEEVTDNGWNLRAEGFRSAAAARKAIQDKLAQLKAEAAGIA